MAKAKVARLRKATKRPATTPGPTPSWQGRCEDSTMAAK
jgi:hypothetical protein